MDVDAGLIWQMKLIFVMLLTHLFERMISLKKFKLADLSDFKITYVYLCHKCRLSLCLLQGAIVKKVVFLIFYQGDALKARVKKVCDGFVCRSIKCLI